MLTKHDSPISRVALGQMISTHSEIIKKGSVTNECSCYHSLAPHSPLWECGLCSDELDDLHEATMEKVIARRRKIVPRCSGTDPVCFHDDDEINSIRQQIKKRAEAKKEEEEKLNLAMERMLTFQYELKCRTLSRR